MVWLALGQLGQWWVAPPGLHVGKQLRVRASVSCGSETRLDLANRTALDRPEPGPLRALAVGRPGRHGGEGLAPPRRCYPDRTPAQCQLPLRV